ncbi:MAG: hypothetical protein F6J93_35790 [Oscillatoria sp. SIO1A7]|nr:hypothetical protein [Oscillatoria sp. SIO1A7]
MGHWAWGIGHCCWRGEAAIWDNFLATLPSLPTPYTLHPTPFSNAQCPMPHAL